MAILFEYIRDDAANQDADRKNDECRQRVRHISDDRSSDACQHAKMQRRETFNNEEDHQDDFDRFSCHIRQRECWIFRSCQFSQFRVKSRGLDQTRDDIANKFC